MEVISVGIGDIKIAEAPQQISTYLGSCIAVCLYSQKRKVGGMLHFMLSSSKLASANLKVNKAKYADTGIIELIDQLKKKYELEARDLEAKIFGGAKVLSGISLNIGGDNEKAAREILSQLKIRITASKTGGEKGYKIRLDLEQGKICCEVFNADKKEYY